MTPDQQKEAAAAALKMNLEFKNSPELRAAFGTLSAYAEHLERPEESRYKIRVNNGKISVVKNQSRQLSGASALEIIQLWKNDPAYQTEFGTFNVFRAYAENFLTGKVQIIGCRTVIAK